LPPYSAIHRVEASTEFIRGLYARYRSDTVIKLRASIKKIIGQQRGIAGGAGHVRNAYGPARPLDEDAVEWIRSETEQPRRRNEIMKDAT
jgi:hypothetical protein